MIKLWTVLFMLASTAAHADTTLHTDLPLSYIEQAGPDSHNKPLIIFLHGSGSNEEDLFDIKDQLPADYTYLSVRAPFEVESDSYQWFNKKAGEGDYDGETDELKSSAGKIVDFIAKATGKYHTQPDKVFLVGFSQGAIMSYEVALRDPEVVRGIAALSGKILPVLKSELKPADNLKQVAIFIGHGTADRKLPYAGATDAETLLQSLSLTPEFHAYPGIGHTISQTEIVDLNSWLQQINQ
ncbi:dienelactone hydrolase family protein [Pseudomonas sp. RTC3]|uniref:alpha/beta hydrolase n=1 Tax=unclassified Pseudomonas TaxID=196821 RepID=UPI002AB39426|nr:MULTISPECIES: dienelactone hydrolase family protein [unclassified Pseudomonas]MEB0062912.1 dienelactone hydrolase family protein [Pseudomonas sp. RTC3]MDY7564314.1 dienelactone hydrolase family protein [Pseudomonas sp. 5C2]MEB0008290.1 dienelactone hydrolase family protein [Pseudomonas sp. RTB2]MEB0017386.1 dienelactone hydrolase family protein [Pseudomonas sp. RTB3]MEB0028191.1 dienelactone hydrolase family protein [Pseudomonas sp. MH9.2]